MQLGVEMDDRAEGSSGLPELGIEPETLSESTRISTIADETKRKSPASETGSVSAVKMSAEGKDDGDAQDASRTNDETQPTPLIEKGTAKTMEKPLTVLIVEDTLELAEVIQATLENMGLDTVHAPHGNKALDKFNEIDPDVVLLDIGLPDMTGWEIMDVLKARYEEAIDEMPIIIIISAYDDPANRLVGKLQGVHSYLIKPFTADEIERTVNEAISSVTK